VVVPQPAHLVYPVFCNRRDRSLPRRGFSRTDSTVVAPCYRRLGYGKLTHRRREGGVLHLPAAMELLRSLAATVRQSASAARLEHVHDGLVEFAEGGDSILEISSSHAKPGWVPPKVVRILDTYYRLESAAESARPRPFVYRVTQARGWSARSQRAALRAA